MNTIGRIAQDRQVKMAMETFRQEQNYILDLTVAIQQIPSPTGAEIEVANFVKQQFLDCMLGDVSQDSLHNTYSRVTGETSERPVIISAHTDTVFPRGTDLTVQFENQGQPFQGLIYGPGIADNSLGVASLIILARTLKKHKLKTKSDIWFVANVGEEGLGDLKGMRAVVNRFGDQALYIVVEGGSYGHIFHEAIGVKRYEIMVETEGGHSWGDYGSPNAIHILSHIISALDEIVLPKEYKTTLNVGVIEGGTTVNTIAAKASCLLDLRSTVPEALAQLVIDVSRLVSEVNNRPSVNVKMTQIGDRPAGTIPREANLVKWAADALKQVGNDHVLFQAGSTDANIPISLGIPAVCIGLANSGNTHRTNEFLDPAHLSQGFGQLLLLTLAAAGFGK